MRPTPAEIDARAAKLYASLQEQGIPLDGAALHQLKDAYRTALSSELAALEHLVGFWPNPNSTDSYVRIARKYGVELPRTPTGRPRTDELITERLGREITAIAMLANARRLRRKVSVLTSLAERLCRERIYPTYHLDAELGRAHAGGDANPMNWEPEIQRLVREPGKRIVVADYERMELKVLATLSGDEQLCQDLKRDPYLEAARSIFDTPNPGPEQRAAAKIATLASIYGQCERGLAAKLHMPTWKARQIQARWAQRYPKATTYLHNLVERGRVEGKAVSYHGRLKVIPASRPPDARDRLVINSPIQNTAGDLARIGFCTLFEDGRTTELGISLLTTVHDSIIMAIPQDASLNQVNTLVRECLVERNDPAFALSINIKVGDNWADARE